MYRPQFGKSWSVSAVNDTDTDNLCLGLHVAKSNCSVTGFKLELFSNCSLYLVTLMFGYEQGSSVRWLITHSLDHPTNFEVSNKVTCTLLRDGEGRA